MGIRTDAEQALARQRALLPTGTTLAGRQSSHPPYVVVRYDGLAESDDISLRLHGVAVWCCVTHNVDDPQDLAVAVVAALEAEGFTVTGIRSAQGVYPPGTPPNPKAPVVDAAIVTAF